MTTDPSEPRPLTDDERQLLRWMLEHGEPEAAGFLSQVDRALASPWKCPCGCASFDLVVAGQPMPPPDGGMQILADFVCGKGPDFGIFCFARNGVLSGVEVYSCALPAPAKLPVPELLTPLSVALAKTGRSDGMR